MNYDLSTEKAILSSIYQFGKDAYVDVSDIINGETFHSSEHQVIYACLEKAISKSDKVSYPLLLSSASELGLDSVLKDNDELLKEIRSTENNLDHVRILAKKLAKLYLVRQGVSKLYSAITALKQITGEETATNILSIIEKPGYEIQQILNRTEEEGQLIGSGAIEYIEALIKTPNRQVGIPTGIKHYDRAIGGGIRRGGFALLGARRKIGKSTLAINIAIYCATKLKIPVLYLDTEMQAHEHLGRIHANQTGIPVLSIEHATFTNNSMFVKQLRDAAAKIEELGITHERVAGKRIEEIISIARRWLKKKVGYHESGKLNNCLIIYDYFKLMDPSSLKNMQEWAALGFQATQLSDFLGEVDAACLALVQLNRESDIAQSDRLSWLATSVCTFHEKTAEEIITDGYENGNRKIVFDVARFGGGLEKDDYINIELNGNLCQIREIGTAREMKEEKRIGKSGFDTDSTDTGDGWEYDMIDNDSSF